MARLYCERHGQEDEARVIKRQEYYHQEDETILIVRGKLQTGPWLCDRCNVELRHDAMAYLSKAFPGWVIHQMTDYDFTDERQYFDLVKADLAVYGAEWPGVRRLIAAGKMSFARKYRQMLEQPCSIDLQAKKPT